MKKKNKKFHLVAYVEGCSSKIRKFTTVKAMNEFILEFTAEFPDQKTGDNWIDFVVTHVDGAIHVFENSGLEEPT